MENSLQKLKKAPGDYSGFAVIGGSGAYDLSLECIGEIGGELTLDTPFDKASPVVFLRPAGCRGTIAFLSRHGTSGYQRTASDVNYRANIWALKEAGTTRILSWSGPGAIDTRFSPGDYVLPDDLLDLTRNRPSTFFSGSGLGFIRQNPVFCPTLRKVLNGVLQKTGVPYHDRAVYAVTEGPRLETPAEVRMLGRLGGELVGMTLAPEAFLARELEICYHPCCYITNWAEGVKELPYRPGELFEGMLEEKLRSRVAAAVEGFTGLVQRSAQELEASEIKDHDCPCAQAMLRYRRSGRIGPDWHTWIQPGKPA